MAKSEVPGSVKRFGARYGKTVKVKFAFIEKEQRALHKCPACSAISVKRLSAGIWQCRRCNKKFAGKAYTPGHVPKLIEAVEEGEIGVLPAAEGKEKEVSEE